MICLTFDVFIRKQCQLLIWFLWWMLGWLIILGLEGQTCSVCKYDPVRFTALFTFLTLLCAEIEYTLSYECFWHKLDHLPPLGLPSGVPFPLPCVFLFFIDLFIDLCLHSKPISYLRLLDLESEWSLLWVALYKFQIMLFELIMFWAVVEHGASAEIYAPPGKLLVCTQVEIKIHRVLNME
jgi:hypothetical protein